MELSEILNGTQPEPASPVEITPAPHEEPAPTTTVEQPAQPRDERGRFASQEPPAETPPNEDRQHTVPVAALLEERRKRQELEARLAAQPPPPEVKDEDYWNAPVETTRKVVDYKTEQLQAHIQNVRYDLAEDFTRTLHPDYDQVRAEFIKRSEANDPMAIAIAQQMGRQSNPAKFVYDQMKRLSQLEPDYETRVRADERARVLAELQKQGRKPAPEVPQSLNSEPSAPSPSTPQSFEPTPFGALFDRQF